MNGRSHDRFAELEAVSSVRPGHYPDEVSRHPWQVIKSGIGDKIRRLLDRGVIFENTLIVYIGDEIDIDRISGDGVEIYGSTRSPTVLPASWRHWCLRSTWPGIEAASVIQQGEQHG